jgi:hypothetical protein
MAAMAITAPAHVDKSPFLVLKGIAHNTFAGEKIISN